MPGATTDNGDCPIFVTDTADRGQVFDLLVNLELDLVLTSGSGVSRVTLNGLDGDQRAAIADLLGMDRYPESTVALTVARLDDVLLDLTGSDARAVTEDMRADRRPGTRQARAGA